MKPGESHLCMLIRVSLWFDIQFFLGFSPCPQYRVICWPLLFEADKHNGHRRCQQLYRRPDSHLFYLEHVYLGTLASRRGPLANLSLTPVGWLHSNRLINITNAHVWDKWMNGWCEQWVLLQTLKWHRRQIARLVTVITNSEESHRQGWGKFYAFTGICRQNKV